MSYEQKKFALKNEFFNEGYFNKNGTLYSIS